MNQIIITRNSVHRIHNFLSLEEIDSDRKINNKTIETTNEEVGGGGEGEEEADENKVAVRIQGDFTWDVDLHSPTLKGTYIYI